MAKLGSRYDGLGAYNPLDPLGKGWGIGNNPMDAVDGVVGLKSESRTMDFENVTEGVSRSGMNGYLEYLRVDVITKILEALDNTDEMSTAINNGWQGQSRDKFLSQLRGAIKASKNDIYKEFSNLADRLSDLYQDYMKQDANMID